MMDGTGYKVDDLISLPLDPDVLQLVKPILKPAQLLP